MSLLAFLLAVLPLVPIQAFSLDNEKPTAVLLSKPAPGESFIYKESAGKPRKMEIYFPSGHDRAKAKVPGLILFHGGGWSGGSLEQFRTACAYFAGRGLVCATAEYRMLGKSDPPESPLDGSRKRVCVTDAKSAIRWFKQHAGELGLDPGRIIAGGGSAGGHISALATLNPGLNDPRDPVDVSTEVVAYLWFNPAFSTDDKGDREVDVLKHQSAALPPTLVFFGDQDNWKQGWDVAHAGWKALGTKSIELQIAPGQPHSFFNREPWRTLTLIAADQFLVQHGLLRGVYNIPPPSSGERLVQVPDN